MKRVLSQTKIRGASAFLVVCLLLVSASAALYGQAKVSDVQDPANGAAVMVAGELWDSYMLFNNMTKGPWYGEATGDVIRQIRVGNFDRGWTTPTHMWPGGWNFGAFWNKSMEISVWDPDTTFNPQTIGGAANPSYFAAAGKNYAFAAFGNTKRGKTLPGTNDPLRNYSVETKWVDAAKRHHAVYEASSPTTVGVDVKLKIHQYSLNWNNFNDFLIVELTLKNTGVVDINADGTPEKTGHVIEGICANMHGEYMSAFGLNEGGGRGNYFFAQRAIGYYGDNDASGSPWAMHIAYPGESGPGVKDMGIFVGGSRYAADVWSAWAWLGAKDASGADFPTRFGTHAVGVGPERGWYVAGNVSKGYAITGDPRHNFVGSMGQFFVDGGKSLNAATFNLAANPNLFEAGSTAGDLRTFVLKPAGSRTAPNGDLKSTNSFGVNTYEPTWTKGYTAANNFDGDGFLGIGPFKLEVDQSVTVTLAVAGGFRLQGVANAIGTARWVYENKVGDYELPFDYPPVPDMRVDNTLAQSIRVRWDNKANAHPDFAGYKVYKTSLSQQVDWLATGTRVLDEYWRNMTPGATPASLLKPINPNFTAQAFVAGRNGVPDGWGPYTLMAVIPAASLASYADNSTAGYNYSWEDKVVDVGFKYWYYVAAYTNKPQTLANYTSFSNNATTDFVETSNVNRNGATGLWRDTYPFATLNSFYPKTADGQKAIGGGFIVKSALANPADLVSGKAKITVKPNPYKKKALFDNATLSYDHKITFMNLPGNAKITILDVAGQVIDEINFQSNDPNNGSIFWDMFSKDGVEVASGLYIYVVEYDGGQHVGYFSILR
jgi:hypothetical protein